MVVMQRQPQLAQRGDVLDAPALDLDLALQLAPDAYGSMLTITCLTSV
jgi:hypothetical protein